MHTYMSMVSQASAVQLAPWLRKLKILWGPSNGAGCRHKFFAVVKTQFFDHTFKNKIWKKFGGQQPHTNPPDLQNWNRLFVTLFECLVKSWGQSTCEAKHEIDACRVERHYNYELRPSAHAQYHVTCRQGVKNNHIFRFPVPTLPERVHFGRWWTLSIWCELGGRA